MDPERKWSRSVVSDSLRPNRLWPARLLCPWDFPGKNIGVGCHFLLQGIFFPTQGSNPSLLHCRQALYHLSHQRRSYGPGPPALGAHSLSHSTTREILRFLILKHLFIPRMILFFFIIPSIHCWMWNFLSFKKVLYIYICYIYICVCVYHLYSIYTCGERNRGISVILKL